MLSIQYLTNLLEPRGIKKSTYLSAESRTCTSSLLSIPRIQEEEKEQEAVAFLTMSTSILLVLAASFPPLSIRPLPLNRERPAICNKASGRASKIIPITPIGKVFFSKTKPGSSSLFSLIFPIGSERLHRSLYPFSTLFSLSGENTRRWRIDDEIPSFSAFSKSLSFSALILSFSSSSNFEIETRASLLSSKEETANNDEAFLTLPKRVINPSIYL